MRLVAGGSFFLQNYEYFYCLPLPPSPDKSHTKVLSIMPWYLVLFLISFVILQIFFYLNCPQLHLTFLVDGRNPKSSVAVRCRMPDSFVRPHYLLSLLHELHFSFPGSVAKLLALAKITAINFAQGTTSVKLWILQVSVFCWRSVLGKVRHCPLYL